MELSHDIKVGLRSIDCQLLTDLINYIVNKSLMSVRHDRFTGGGHAARSIPGRWRYRKQMAGYRAYQEKVEIC